MKLFIDRVKSPIGEIRIVSDGENLRALDFEDYEERMEKLLKRHYGTFELEPMKNPNGVSEVIERYFRAANIVDGDKGRKEERT